jgi:hypothetical protein
MKRYLRIGTTIAAGLLAANVAHATLYSETTAGNLTVNLGYNPAVANDYAVLHTNDGAFTDIFQFRLTEAGPSTTASASYASLKLLNLYNLTNATFGLYTSTGTLVQSGNITALGAGQSVGTITSGPLDNGSYYYKLTGDSVGSAGASYLFTQTVNPVPEPSTYALMLLGLLGIGYVGVRQARKAAGGMSAGLAA